MSRYFDGSDDYLEYATASFPGYPFTVACWFNVANTTADHELWYAGSSSANTNYWELCAAGAQTGDYLRFVARNTTERAAQSSVAYTANTWQHACGVAASSSSRIVYLDGGNTGTNTNGTTPTVNRSAIGVFDGSTRSKYASGQIAEFAMWSVALTAAEVAALAKGANPWTVRPTAITCYMPLWGFTSPEIDLSGAGRSFSVSSSTQGTTHAPVGRRFQKRNMIYVPKTFSTYDDSLTVSGTASFSPDATKITPILADSTFSGTAAYATTGTNLDAIQVYQTLSQVEVGETPGIEVYQTLAQVEYENAQYATFSGTSAFASDRIWNGNPDLTVSGTASIAQNRDYQSNPTPEFSSTAGYTSDAEKQTSLTGDLTVSGTASFSPVSDAQYYPTSIYSGTAGYDTSVNAIRPADLTLSATAAFDPSTIRTTPKDSTFSGTAGFTSDSSRASAKDATFSGTGSYTTTVIKESPVSVSFGGTAGFSPIGTASQGVAVGLSGTASFYSDTGNEGISSFDGTAAYVPLATLTGSPGLSINGTAAFAAMTNHNSSSASLFSATAAYAATATISGGAVSAGNPVLLMGL